MLQFQTAHWNLQDGGTPDLPSYCQETGCPSDCSSYPISSIAKVSCTLDSLILDFPALIRSGCGWSQSLSIPGVRQDNVVISCSGDIYTMTMYINQFSTPTIFGTLTGNPILYQNCPGLTWSLSGTLAVIPGGFQSVTAVVEVS